MESKKFSLNLNDFWKGLLVAAGVSAATAAQQALDSGVINGKGIAMAGVSGAVIYLIHAFKQGDPK